MILALPAFLKGSLFVLFCSLNTVLCFSILLPAICLKPLTDRTPLAPYLGLFLTVCVSYWADGNSRVLEKLLQTEWDLQIPEDLAEKHWYLLISNHQSWADIFILFKVLNRKIPFPKYFVKDKLLWLPVLGPVFWAMDFPIMKRYSKSYLEKHPEQRGKDLETTRRSCEKFKYIPTTVINFPEGTRYRPAKAKAQNSPYHHLLLPRAGGAALALYSMGEYFTAALNVTIAYSTEHATCWQFISGQIKRITVRVELIPIPGEFIQRDYRTDQQFRENFQAWINQKWKAKDRLIEDFASRDAEAFAQEEKRQIVTQ
ncbi:MAG: acyltransferase [SAR324 cluster bacterium]|nr:acyltransferase [SAR324 cluster bacterium]